MKSKIKKQFFPLVFILSIFTINTYLWIIFMNRAFLAQDVMITAILGSTLLMGFFLVFLLSTRNRIIVWIFGGLENLYFWHRMLAIGTTAFIFVHQFLSTGRGILSQPDLFILGKATDAGEMARNIFIFLVIAALLAKFMKYQHFRFIHRLLLIPYIFGLYHGFFTSVLNLFSFNALSIWMLSTSIIGLGSSIYMILIYQKSAFSKKGVVVEKYMLNDSVMELKVKMSRRYKMLPGQFAFIKIKAEGLSQEPHPFSISGVDDKYIYFTIKSLGDFTKKMTETDLVYANISVTKPFGKMTFKTKHKHQVFVAGGIGLTPFLSYLRSTPVIESNVHLYYSVRNIDEAVHIETLQEIARENEMFTFTLHDTSVDGYLSVQNLEFEHNSILYMCGPRPMVLSIEKQMRNTHPDVPIFYEAFSFTGTLVDDIIKFIKRIIRKPKVKKSPQ